MDCFGDPAVTGKIGTDIEDGKCSWLAVVALQRCSKEQRTLMEVISGFVHYFLHNIYTTWLI